MFPQTAHFRRPRGSVTGSFQAARGRDPPSPIATLKPIAIPGEVESQIGHRSFTGPNRVRTQIIDYGDAELEKKQIYLRHLERVIQPENYSAPIDLSGVVLQQVKQIDQGKVDISLGARVGLSSLTAAGSGEKRDPTMVAFQQVLDRLNDLFGSEDFTQSQKISFLESLLRTLLDDDALVQQATVNSTKQFVESPDFDDAVTGAVADNQGAHVKMSDYFFTNAPGRGALISDIAKWFYQVVAEQNDVPLVHGDGGAEFGKWASPSAGQKGAPTKASRDTDAST